MSDENGLNIVTADGETERVCVTLKRKRYDVKGCDHLSIEVDTESGAVTCADCGSWIDPVQFMVRWAQRRERDDHELKEIYAHRLEVHQRAKRDHEAAERGERHAYKALYEEAEIELGQARAEIHWLKKELEKYAAAVTKDGKGGA
jgi:hypothetical protein